MIVGEPLRVLIATHSLTGFTGTDLYTRDLALALFRTGLRPVIYSKRTGALAEELRSASIPVVTDLGALTAPPHVIQGHHSLETMSALSRFPGVPAVFVCHDARAWHSLPPESPRIGVYVAVDENCRERLRRDGIPEESIRVLKNAVDLRRFAQRPPLPAEPRRALVFSNQARDDGWVSPIRSACERRGIAVDVAGSGSGHWVGRPEDLLSGYDIVFGKARCALEALATGASVIVCDAAGLAGMVTTSNVDDWRQWNFGARTLTRPIARDSIDQELAGYDALDARAVSNRIRSVASVDLLAADFVSLYEDVCSKPVSFTAADELLASARSLERVMEAMYGESDRRRPFPSRVVRRLSESKWLSFAVRLLRRLIPA